MPTTPYARCSHSLAVMVIRWCVFGCKSFCRLPHTSFLFCLSSGLWRKRAWGLFVSKMVKFVKVLSFAGVSSCVIVLNTVYVGYVRRVRAFTVGTFKQYHISQCSKQDRTRESAEEFTGKTD